MVQPCWFILMIAFLFFSGCSNDQTSQAGNTVTGQPAAAAPQPAANQPFRTVSPREAADLIKNSKDLLIVDVRTPQEVKQDGAIKGSVMIPFWAVMRGQHNLPKDRPLLLVCAVGGRSYAAGQMLVRRQGYRQVYNLGGGISAWKKTGLPVTY